MNRFHTLLLAGLAVLVLLGGTVYAQAGEPALISAPAGVADKEALKAQYIQQKMAQIKAMEAQKIEAHKGVFDGKALTADEDSAVSVLADRIPADVLAKKLAGLSAEDKAKVLAALKMKLQGSVDHQAEIEKKRDEIAARLKEIEDASSVADPSQKAIARLDLAVKLCAREEANDDSKCKDILAKYAADKDKKTLTAAERTAIQAKLEGIQMLWIEKHYAEWLLQAQQLDTKLVRVDTKLQDLVTRTTNANSDLVAGLTSLQEKFTRIHTAYTGKVQAMTDAYTAYMADKTFANALKVRAAAVEVKYFGKFAVHAVNRFVYLYHHVNDDSTTGTPTISASEITDIVNEVPEPTDISAQATTEVAATVATDDHSAQELTSGDDSSTMAPSGEDNSASDDGSSNSGSDSGSSDNSGSNDTSNTAGVTQ